MGMFDYLRCDYPLPDDPPEWVKRDNEKFSFQTKDTPRQWMERYIITSDGKLIHQAVDYIETPLEERPHYGEPDFATSPVLQLAGCTRAVPLGDVWLYDYHGDLFFYTSGKDVSDWYEYRARFSEGKLLSIIRVTK